jgi:hypothetical protein
MIHAPDYFHLLKERLQKQFPDRQITLTYAIQVLDEIWHDIQSSQAPFQSFAELYRDEIHLTTQSGRYLAHNLMRSALGQPISDQGFQIDAVQKAYFDKKIGSAARMRAAD